ncbi:magnesium transporter [Garciella nitratireducens]|uniref:Magnesium transporter MgtE n=1 Tax=Garciella nitratireducens DSM 15102 TaxID=1121911 RepID=A0A1T4LLX8_9FIRM|nr:magnesium transporter [Garciella nitratireducens]SJZ55739.1 magnesium transporter [Garciella nitratireducens DSM 15102]
MKEILKMLEHKEYKKLRQQLEIMKPADIAEILEDLSHKNALFLFRLLPKDLAVEVFSHMSPYDQAKLSELFNVEELQQLVKELNFDDKIDFLEELPAQLVKRILKNAQVQERTLINQFLNYPEYSAGSLMTIEFVDLKKEMTAQEAIEHISKTGFKKETIYTCYVIDAYRKLEGIVSLKNIILAEENEKIENLMERDFISITTTEDQEEIAEIFKKYDLLAIPVVDLENRLVGIITVDDIIDTIEEENTEDFHKMAGLKPSKREYMDSSVLSLTKHRLPWLMILMITATFTGAIIKSFEEVISKVAALAVFIPMLMDNGGNAGSQSSTLVIRSMALGEVAPKDILKVIWKEFRVSLIVGLSLAILNFLRILLFENYPIAISLIVSVTIFITIILAEVIGGTLPILAKILKLDPAIMASPMLSTILDALVLFTYFSISKAILHL